MWPRRRSLLLHERAASSRSFCQWASPRRTASIHERGAAEDARYTLPPAPLPDTPATRRDMAAFKASARVLDEGMGAGA